MSRMRRLSHFAIAAVAGAAIGIAVWQANAQQPQNAFPLAAPAGRDSNARQTPPAGAVNQGPFNANNFQYGHTFDAPPGTKLWNPAKIKLMAGGKLVGGTVLGTADPATYCAMANGG